MLLEGQRLGWWEVGGSEATFIISVLKHKTVHDR